jgi:hypothetical protein
MKTTGVFTTHTFNIPFEKYGEPIYLVPFGDVHRSSPMCDTERWIEMLGWAKTKSRCYFLGMGDYDDLGSSSERLLLGHKALHDSTVNTLENLYLKHTTRFYKEISFMGGKIIGLMEGNHFGEFQNGTTTTQKLAEMMKCKYLGVSTFIRLRFKQKNARHGSMCVDIWAHHGMGAARLVGGSLNRVEQMLEAAECDIALMGHDHKKSIGTKTRFRLVTSSGAEGVRLSHRKVLIGRTGSFLKGYEEGRPSYIADAAMNPTDLGVIKIEMTPRRDRSQKDDRMFIDLHGSI